CLPASLTSVAATTTRPWKVCGVRSKPNWSIVGISIAVLKPKTPSLPTSKAGITAYGVIRRWATLVPNSLNNSFSLNCWSTQMVQGHFCDVTTCCRKIFVERLSPFIEPWARVTARLFELVQVIGLATGGMLGVHVTDQASIKTSWKTIIRRI